MPSSHTQAGPCRVLRTVPYPTLPCPVLPCPTCCTWYEILEHTHTRPYTYLGTAVPYTPGHPKTVLSRQDPEPFWAVLGHSLLGLGPGLHSTARTVPPPVPAGPLRPPSHVLAIASNISKPKGPGNGAGVDHGGMHLASTPTIDTLSISLCGLLSFASCFMTTMAYAATSHLRSTAPITVPIHANINMDRSPPHTSPSAEHSSKSAPKRKGEDGPIHPLHDTRVAERDWTKTDSTLVGSPGTRSVSTLTPAQLARKRANDREAQRAIRARTKEHIERLERELEQYKKLYSTDDRIQELAKRIDALESENKTLREQAAQNGLPVPTTPAGSTSFHHGKTPRDRTPPTCPSACLLACSFARSLARSSLRNLSFHSSPLTASSLRARPSVNAQCRDQRSLQPVWPHRPGIV